jgi:hypothetical protein
MVSNKDKDIANGVLNDAIKRRDVEKAAERWRVAKDIPVTLVAAIILQTVFGVWWLSQLSSKLDIAVANLAEFKNERYTRDDARRDRELIDQKLVTQSLVGADQLRRLVDLESKVQRLEQAVRK